MAILTILAWTAVALGALSAIVVLVDIAAGHRQPMWIMEAVWPVTALYAGPVGLWAYFRFGRAAGRIQHSQGRMHHAHEKAHGPLWQSTLLATTHCGAGCTLGDLTAEAWTAHFPFPLFGRPLFGAWLLDFIAAFLFGIAFQFFSIRPMGRLSNGEALRRAFKADSASLTAWQVGMYGFMALVMFVLLPRGVARAGPVFWFAMQGAMLAGAATSFPVNWWLLQAHVKEPM